MGEIEKNVIELEGINGEMFKVKEIKEISSKGSRRALSAPFMDFSFLEKEKSVNFKFSLFRGSYATSFLREFMKVDDLLSY